MNQIVFVSIGGVCTLHYHSFIILTRHLCSNKNFYLSSSNSNVSKYYLLLQYAVNTAEKSYLSNAVCSKIFAKKCKENVEKYKIGNKNFRKIKLLPLN